MTAASHARKNLLTGEWILVSPQRNQRPWQGQIETKEADDLPEYDSDCYLCPGNTRANGEVNPDYRGTYVFANDFPALTEESQMSRTTRIRFSIIGKSQASAGCFASMSDMISAWPR